MKKAFLLKIMIFCLCSHFFADVANSVKSVCVFESPFCLSKKKDGALLGTGIFFIRSGFAFGQRFKNQSADVWWKPQFWKKICKRFWQTFYERLQFSARQSWRKHFFVLCNGISDFYFGKISKKRMENCRLNVYRNSFNREWN